jgi:hypothetical protein
MTDASDIQGRVRSRLARDIPAVPDSVQDADLRKLLTGVREAVQELTSARGSGMNAAVRWSDLVDKGFADGRTLGPAAGLGGGSVTIVSGGSGGAAAYEPDLTPPPTLTGLAAAPGFTQLMVSWNVPVFTQGHGPAGVRIYAVRRDPADTHMPTFPGSAGLVAFAPHPLPLLAIASEPNVRWHLWAKYVTVDGVESASPAGGTNGLIVTTGQDIAGLLASLQGQITASQLHATLAEPIARVDAPASTAGSVAARVQAEAQARADADLAAIATAASYTASYAYSKSETGAQIAAAGTALRSEWQGADATVLAAAQAYTYGRSSIDGALSAQASALRAEFAAADGSTLTSARAYTDSAAYAKADGQALATAVSGLQAITYPKGEALNLDPLMRSGVDWRDGGHGPMASRIQISDGIAGEWCFTSPLGGGGASIDSVSPIQLIAGRTYRIGAHVRSINGASAPFFLRWVELDAGGSPVIQHLVPGVEGIFPPADAVWRSYTALFVAPASAFVCIRAILHWGEGAGEHQIQNFRLTDETETAAVSASLQTTQTALATLDGRASAAYTVRTTLSAGGRTLVGGFGLMGDSDSPPGSEIEFGVLANRFWVGAPAGSGVADSQLFTVQTTTWSDNGVTRPAGVFIDAAYIRNLQAVYATIGNLVADQISAASISASRITAGTLQVGADIRSTGYVSGVAGWRITGAGVIELLDAYVRGTVVATAGSIGGITITGTGITSPGYSGGDGFSLSTAGIFRASAGGGARVIDMGATGTNPVIKHPALELRADGYGYFSGALQFGVVTAVSASGASLEFPSLKDITTYSSGQLGMSPAVSISATGGVVSGTARVSVEIAAQSTAVDYATVTMTLYLNGVEVDAATVYQKAVPYTGPTGTARTVRATAALICPAAMRSGTQTLTIGVVFGLRNSSGVLVNIGTSDFTSYLGITAKANLHEARA